MQYIKRNKSHIAVLFLFILLASIVTYPLIFHLGSFVPGLGDQLLVSWTMNWDLYALFHQPLQLFNAPIFYPYHNTLAYSDTYITSALLSFIPLLLIKQPIVTYSFNLLLSLTLLGYFTYLLTQYLTKDHLAGIISGVLVAFCTFTLGKISVLQLVSIQYVPLGLFLFIRYIDTKRVRWFIGFCLAFLLQVYNSFLPGYFILISIVPILILYRNQFFNLFLKRTIILISAITALLIVPTAYPYYSVSKEFHYVRDIRDTISFANRIRDTFYPPDTTILQNELNTLFYAHDPNKLVYVGYLGLLFTISLVACVLYYFLNRKQISNKWFLWSGVVALTGYILSLGPAFQWGDHIVKKPFIIPLPYVLFYYLVPGFKGMRNSGRWEMLFILAVSIFVALCLSAFLKGKAMWYKFLFTTLFVLGVLVEISFPLHFNTVPAKESFPKVYSYLAAKPREEATIELPLFSWFMGQPFLFETMREYYNTTDFHPMVNGYSGYSPIAWENRSVLYQFHFPDDETVGYLKSINVKYILIHKKDYDYLEKNHFSLNNKSVRTWNEVQQGLLKYPFIHLVKKFGDDYLYEIS